MREVDKIQIQIQEHDGSISECFLTIGYIKDAIGISDWVIILSGADCTDVYFKATDLFKALVSMRKELEKRGSTPLCQGLRKDIIVSGMSRSMGGGRKAYVIRLGWHSYKLIDIFDYAPPSSISSLKEQDKYQKEWLETPKKNGLMNFLYSLKSFWSSKFTRLKIPK